VLVNLLEAKRRAVETLDLDVRVQALEKAAAGKKDNRDPTFLKKVA